MPMINNVKTNNFDLKLDCYLLDYQQDMLV
jgi:hypothetical protein